MRTLVITIALFSLTTHAFAQNERIRIATVPFTQTTYALDETRAAAWARVMSSSRLSDRFTLISNDAAIDTVWHKQRGEEYLDGIVTALAAESPQYLLLGEIKRAEVTEIEKDGVKFYWASVSYIVQKASVATRRIVCDGEIESKFSPLTLLKRALFQTRNAALEKAVDDTAPQVEAFLESCFPLTFEILAVEKEKGDRVQEVLISGGQEWGLSSGQKLRVLELQEIGTRTREIEIASIKIKEVQGTGFSLCQVMGKKGQQSLHDAMARQAKLIITTAPKE